MSTRIHKMMGYGTSEKVFHDRDWFDRIDDIGESRVHAMIQKSNPGNSDVSLAFESRHPNWKGPYPRARDLVKFADYTDEDEGRIVFATPMNFKKWFRYDDDIDFQESDRENLTTEVKMIDSPLYPYLNYMDAETGEKVPMDRPLFKLKEEYGDSIVPIVPTVIRILVKELKPLDDPMLWLKLRPMIVTWWS